MGALHQDQLVGLEAGEEVPSRRMKEAEEAKSCLRPTGRFPPLRTTLSSAMAAGPVASVILAGLTIWQPGEARPVAYYPTAMADIAEVPAAILEE